MIVSSNVNRKNSIVSLYSSVINFCFKCASAFNNANINYNEVVLLPVEVVVLISQKNNYDQISPAISFNEFKKVAEDELNYTNFRNIEFNSVNDILARAPALRTVVETNILDYRTVIDPTTGRLNYLNSTPANETALLQALANILQEFEDDSVDQTIVQANLP